MDQKSDFGHVRTYCWLNKLRNIHRKTYGTYLILIYMKYLRNFGGRVCVLCFCSFIFLYYEYLWIFLLYSSYVPYIFPKYFPYLFIYVYIPYMFHIFSLVCFLIYSVNSRSGHDQITTFGQVLHVSDPKLTFRGSSRWFCMVLCGGTKEKNLVVSLNTKNLPVVFLHPSTKLNVPLSSVPNWTKSRHLVMPGPTVDWIN